METLTYGFKKPESGDLASVWQGAIEDNITRLDGHDHDGTNSKSLNPASITAATNTIAAGSWAADGSWYKQTITLPSTVDMENVTVSFYDTDNDLLIHPTIDTITSSNYVIRVNDNTLNLKAIYK